MKKYILLLFLYMISSLAYSQYDILVWQDEFDYSGVPDPEKWSYDVGGHGWGNNELQYYTENREENARVEDGKLIIEARKENYSGNDYTSARLVTKNKGDWAYGRIEVKARLPEGVGTWPAIWMLPTEWIYGDGNWPDVGEIDIMEHVGYDEGVVHGTIHTHDYNHMDGTQKGDKINVEDATSAFHVYAIEWTENKIEWFVDDTKFFTFENNGDGWSSWPFDHPFHLILNIAIGGDWGGAEGVDDSIFPQKMEIDYVRIYKTSNQLNSLIEGKDELVPNAAAVKYSPKMLNGENYQWDYPADAEMIEQDEEGNIWFDWGCQGGDVILSADIDSKTYMDTISVSQKEIEIQGNLFWNTADEPLLFFVDSMHNTGYEWSVPGFSTIIEGQGSSSIAVDWGQDNGEVNMALSNNCVDEEFSRQVFDPNKQYPYPNPLEAHILPGRIKAVNYDYGGEGVAYHDLGSLNTGDGPRQDEGVDTEYYDTSSYVGWINSGEWLEYSVKVEDTCWALASVKVSSEGGGGPIQIKINGQEKLDEFNVPDTEGWTNFTTLDAGLIKLTPQDTVLRVEAEGDGFNISEIIFTESEATDIQRVQEEDSFQIYPNPAEDILTIQAEIDIEYVEIWNLQGMMVKKDFYNNSGDLKIDVSDLNTGLHVLRIINSNGEIVNKRFVKR